MDFKHTLIVTVATAAAWVTAAGQAPEGYYRSIDGKAEAELKTALCNLLYDHTEISSYIALPEYFKHTDVYPGTNRYWDMYSDIPVYTNTTFGTYLNREHSFPKSWWGGSTATPAYVDLNHLYPSEKGANSAKSNYPLGTVSTATFDNGVVKVGYPVTGQGGGSGKVFEPDDEYKGDFARTYFYMVTTYQNLHWESKYCWMMQNNTYPTLQPWAVDLLLKWHREDKVSQKEIDRNNVVYGYQNNRNPFIDFPELAEYLWGNKVGEVFHVEQGGIPSGDPTLITPVQDMELDFGEVALGSTGKARLQFRGTDLRGSLQLLLSRDDKEMFSIPQQYIYSSQVNSESGFWLEVSYTPTALGEHRTRLIISDGGLEGSRGVGLRGTCLPVPTLTAPVALPASDITDDSYVANWELPVAGEIVDYYIVRRTRYQGASSSTEELVADDNSLLIEDFGSSDSESYTVRSARMGYESSPSNVITVDHAGVQGVMTESALGVVPCEGGVRIVTAVPQNGLRVIDMQGRVVRTLDGVRDNDIIMLPGGVYIIVTDTHMTPQRVVVR